MADPEDLIRGLPPASPPPEMVKIALRMFRYRAMAVVALIVALTAVGLLLSSRVTGVTSLEQQVAAARLRGSTQTIAQEKTVAGVRVLLWEVVVVGGTDVVHAQAWGPGGHPFDINVSQMSVGPYTPGPLGGEEVSGSGGGPSYAETWASYANRLPPSGSSPASVSIDVFTPSPPGSQIPPQKLGTATFNFTLFGGIG